MGQAAGKECKITELGLNHFGVTDQNLRSSSLRNEKIAQISCGANHSAILCKSGRVFVFGGNSYGQLGLGSVGATVTEPTPVKSPNKSDPIIQATCGYTFTLFLTAKGTVVVCGLYGQLGLGCKTDSRGTIQVITSPRAVKRLAAGATHALALTNSGEVWVTGRNVFGQLGLGHNVDQTLFSRVPLTCGPISDIACGGSHTAILSAAGVLLVTGCNNCGQLGLTGHENTSTFTPVALPSPVAAVACGSGHTVSLTADGRVWTWGSNSCGQLGTGITGNTSSPHQVSGIEQHTVVNVTAGYSHTALLTKDGNILLCGRGADGELGKGKLDLTVATLMTKSDELFIQQVAFARGYTLMSVVTNTKNKSQPVEMKGIDGTNVSLLECPVCVNIMGPPIQMCRKGHSICNTCWLQVKTKGCPVCREPFQGARNFALENISTEVQLPCTDCNARMPACELSGHSDVCPKWMFDCPLMKLCGWRGKLRDVLAHASTKHPDLTWKNLPHVFVHRTSDEIDHTNLLVAQDCGLFVLHHKYNKTARMFQAAMKYLGRNEQVPMYKFEFEFMGVDSELIFRKKVSLSEASAAEMFLSATCVTLETQQLESLMRGDRLLCQVNVLKPRNNDRGKHLLTT